jgi:hypothetical protein
MSGDNHTALVVTPQTGYPQIRWADNGAGSGECGWVGVCSMWVFQIWRPYPERQWELICNLPGSRSKANDKDLDELKGIADRWLRWFLDDLYNTSRKFGS